MLTLSSTLIRAQVRHGCQTIWSALAGAQTDSDRQLCLSPTHLPSKSQFNNINNKNNNKPKNNKRTTWFQVLICITEACNFSIMSAGFSLFLSHIYAIDWIVPKSREQLTDRGSRMSVQIFTWEQMNRKIEALRSYRLNNILKTSTKLSQILLILLQKSALFVR